jgi:hypothetical protein
MDEKDVNISRSSAIGPEAGIEEAKAEVGFEPTNNGFAIRPLSPLGYSALFLRE